MENKVDTAEKTDVKLDAKEATTTHHMVKSGGDLPDACQHILNDDSTAFDGVGDLTDAIANMISSVENIEQLIINQVEEQIVELKSAIVAVDHVLPEDELQNSQVILMNTSKENFIESFADSDAMENTEIGRDIRANHMHAYMSAVNAIHGIFPLFPLGSADEKEATEQYTALMNLTKLANRNTFHVYYSVDVARSAYTIKNGNKCPLEKLSDLNGRHTDINEWLNDYAESPFYQKISKDASPALLRRMTAVFNPYLGHTETMSNFYRGDNPLDEDYAKLLDKAPWIPPSSFVAQRLVTNYEKLGWCGGLFGLLNSARQISDYSNPKPKLAQRGLSFTKEMDYRYGITLYNYLSDREGQRMIELGLTPLQRQIQGDEEWIALAEAQSLLPPPPNFDDNMNKEKFEQLSKVRQEEYRAKAAQKMYNYLGNGLLEDTVNRGLMLLCRKFIGSVGNGTEDNLRDVVKEFMTIFAGKPGSNSSAPYNSFTPALESYEIQELSVMGQTAFVTVKIRPVPALRKVVLFVDMDPLGFDIDVDADRY